MPPSGKPGKHLAQCERRERALDQHRAPVLVREQHRGHDRDIKPVQQALVGAQLLLRLGRGDVLLDTTAVSLAVVTLLVVAQGRQPVRRLQNCGGLARAGRVDHGDRHPANLQILRLDKRAQIAIEQRAGGTVRVYENVDNTLALALGNPGRIREVSQHRVGGRACLR